MYTYLNRTNIHTHQSINTVRSPAQDIISGEIRLCYLDDNSKKIFGISRDELTQHVLITGRSGTGKTTAMRCMMIELSRLEIPWMSFDITKHGTRYLVKYLPNLIVLRWDKEFFFNVFEHPPGVKPMDHLLNVCEVTSEIFSFKTASA